MEGRSYLHLLRCLYFFIDLISCSGHLKPNYNDT